MRRRKKKKVHNGYKHWRKIGKPRKETSHLVASPATAMKLVKRGKKGRRFFQRYTANTLVPKEKQCIFHQPLQ